MFKKLSTEIQNVITNGRGRRMSQSMCNENKTTINNKQCHQIDPHIAGSNWKVVKECTLGITTLHLESKRMVYYCWQTHQ